MEFQPEALVDPYVNLSIHTVLFTQSVNRFSPYPALHLLTIRAIMPGCSRSAAQMIAAQALASLPAS